MQMGKLARRSWDTRRAMDTLSLTDSVTDRVSKRVRAATVTRHSSAVKFVECVGAFGGEQKGVLRVRWLRWRKYCDCMSDGRVFGEGVTGVGEWMNDFRIMYGVLTGGEALDAGDCMV